MDSVNNNIEYLINQPVVNFTVKNMTKQECLEIIAPYFPYEVKCLPLDIDSPIDQLCTIVEASLNSLTLLVNGVRVFFDARRIRLILHPTSDLTKPCLEGGKIPIIELAKLASSEDDWEILDTYTSIKYVNEDYYLFYFDPLFMSFYYEFWAYGGRTEISKSFNQLESFNYLYKHHFDVSGLIKKGLAIDINSIKDK